MGFAGVVRVACPTARKTNKKKLAVLRQRNGLLLRRCTIWSVVCVDNAVENDGGHTV